ncbi:hypothetical protein [Allohahella marinimesophila]|uniref:Uncharacterized protein n=1 Tax=Allohahella marinimesophila TaxID=1054972 RepID=A0ABP7NFV4_9GAMM
MATPVKDISAAQATAMLANIDSPQAGDQVVPPFDHGAFVSSKNFMSGAYFEAAFRRLSSDEVEVLLRFYDFDFDDGSYAFKADDSISSSWQDCLALVESHLAAIAAEKI